MVAGCWASRLRAWAEDGNVTALVTCYHHQRFCLACRRDSQVGQKILETILDMLQTFSLEFEIFALMFRGHRIHQSKGAIMEMAIYFWLRIAPGHHVTQARE